MDTQNNARGRSVFGKCFCYADIQRRKLTVEFVGEPSHAGAFMKRLRKSLPTKVRYFGCGEYGDQTMRPHYHLALFNFPSCRRGITNLRKDGRPCCESCSIISDAWGLGGVMLGTLEPKSIAYIAGYVTKKMTRDDDSRLEGRLPEFARMSLRPGIGLGMMHELASTLLQHKLDEKMIDVPLSLQHGKKQWPLGRYLRRKLRTFVDLPPETPYEVIQENQKEVQRLREIAWNDQRPLSEVYLESTLGKRIQIEARERRLKKRTTI